MLRALIFDFDGLIIDTETPLIDAFAEVHRQHGIPYDPVDALSVVGHVDVDYEPWRAFPPEHNRSELERLWHVTKRRLVLAQTVLPGVLDLITGARERGLKLGIASNSTHGWVDAHLERLGLRHYFDIIRCRDDVSVGKPDPEVYVTALRTIGVSAAEAISFEDSPPGSQAAHAAGLYSVVAPNPSTRHHTFPHADRVLTTLAEVTLDEWMHLERWSVPR